MTASHSLTTTCSELPDMFSGLPPQDPFSIAKDNLAAELTALMLHENTTRADMARKLNWPKSRISSVLSGRGNPTLKTIFDFCSTLGYAVDCVFRQHHEQAAQQPWEKVCELSIDTHTVPGVQINLHTVREVVSDFMNGTGKEFYLSFSPVAHKISDSPSFVIDLASTTSQFSTHTINSVTRPLPALDFFESIQK